MGGTKELSQRNVGKRELSWKSGLGAARRRVAGTRQEYI